MHPRCLCPIVCEADVQVMRIKWNGCNRAPRLSNLNLPYVRDLSLEVNRIFQLKLLVFV